MAISRPELTKILAQSQLAKHESYKFLSQVYSGYGDDYPSEETVERHQKLLLRWYMLGRLDTQKLYEKDNETT
jgi:hypothetical protein